MICSEWQRRLFVSANIYSFGRGVVDDNSDIFWCKYSRKRHVLYASMVSNSTTQKWKTMIVIGHIGYRKYKYWETLDDMMCLETIFRTHIVVHGLLYIVFGFSEIFLIAMFEMLCKLIKANNTSFCHHACRALSIHIGLWSIRGKVYRLVVPLAELNLANRAEHF